MFTQISTTRLGFFGEQPQENKETLKNELKKQETQHLTHGQKRQKNTTAILNNIDATTTISCHSTSTNVVMVMLSVVYHFLQL